MHNWICHFELAAQALSPAEAIVQIVVTPERITPTTEIRGRLIGPRCAYAATVEVAYPLRPLAAPGAPGTLACRAVIPEPSLWDPQSPFLYRVVIELWQDGERCDQVAVWQGLRRLALGGRGMIVNGRVLALAGVALEDCSEEEAAALRQAGCNLLIVPVREDTESLWELGDRLGFLVIGRIDHVETGELIRGRERYASCCGWMMPDPARCPSGLIGFLPGGTAKTGRDFIACAASAADGLTDARAPLLLFGDPAQQAPKPGLVLGWVRTRQTDLPHALNDDLA